MHTYNTQIERYVTGTGVRTKKISYFDPQVLLRLVGGPVSGGHYFWFWITSCLYICLSSDSLAGPPQGPRPGVQEHRVCLHYWSFLLPFLESNLLDCVSGGFRCGSSTWR